jgi:hypothetical protein
MLRVGALPEYIFADKYYEDLLSNRSSRTALCRVTDATDHTVAACLVMEDESLTHYHLSGSSADGSRVGANSLMLWEVMKWASIRGSQTLMLGGGVRNDDALYKFKRSFSKTTRPYRAFGIVLSADTFGALVVARAAETSSSPEELKATGYFPAYRANP